jgi:hypothetical protein
MFLIYHLSQHGSQIGPRRVPISMLHSSWLLMLILLVSSCKSPSLQTETKKQLVSDLEVQEVQQVMIPGEWPLEFTIPVTSVKYQQLSNLLNPITSQVNTPRRRPRIGCGILNVAEV